MITKHPKAGYRPAFVKSLLGATCTTPLLFAVMPAMAQQTQSGRMTMDEQQRVIQQQQETIEQMRSQMNSLQSRFQEFSAQRQPPKSNPDDNMASAEPVEDKPGFEVGNTTFELGGYVKLDTIYNFNGDDGASLGPSDVVQDVPRTGSDPHFGATAKQSRLTISSSTPTDIGEVASYFEMDFYGGGFGLDGNYQPRLRQGYLTVGNWLFGKAWSTFSDFNYGTMLNFYGPQAQLFERQAQIRYTWNIAENYSLDFGVEASDGHTIEFDDNGIDVGGRTQDIDREGRGADEQWPDLAMRFNGSNGNLSYQAAGVLTFLEYDGANADGDDSAVGYGLDLGGSYALPTDTTLMLSANYTQGAAKYVYEPAGGPDAYIGDNGNLETIERYGYIATLSQELSEKWETNLVWGQGFSEEYLDDPTTHDRSSTLALNLLYTPVDPLTLGVEYDRAAYKAHSGRDGEANWLQFSAIYNF